MKSEDMGRRGFLTAATGAAAFTILKPQVVRGMQANSAVRVGLLGCGGRGSTHLETILKNTDAHVTALADMFPDRLEKAKQLVDQLSSAKGQPGVQKTFVGPHSYLEILESKDIDAIVIATPPYFHVQHLAAAVDAGKHVYCEKPVAIDVPGAKRVLEIGKKAEGKVSLDVGFQIRMAPPYIELVNRIHQGALGDIATGAAFYYCPRIGLNYPDEATPLSRLRNWIQDKTLSGDIIVEQNIHAIDICNWVMQGHPTKAGGRHGHNGRNMFPNDTCSSHFDIVFQYANGVDVGFSSTQFGKGQFDVNERFFGTKGSSSSPYSGPLGIWGDEKWVFGGDSDKQDAGAGNFSASGNFSDNLAQADSEKQKGFINSISSNKFHNQAALGVESALTAMLGRNAAYEGRELTWDELLRSKEVLEPHIDLNKL
ncbi:MAG TPA: Gfo/Idh/MocA family oxidoreductase [Bryobacteraceae bacterium]|nr:Gfo/Idh/MocA family oxidoreductase [Bryobacteraceae bacterium]